MNNTKKAAASVLAVISALSLASALPAAAAENNVRIPAVQAKVSKEKALSAPAGLKAEYSAERVFLSWNKVSGAKGYRVFIYNSKSGTYKKLTDVTSASCTIKSLKAGKTYYFKVAAMSGNTVGTMSEALALKAKKIKSPVPLESLKWDTDYHSLTNAKACKASEGDFKFDLDGDGKAETINFTHTAGTPEKYRYEPDDHYVIPYINGKKTEIVFPKTEYGDMYAKYDFNFPSGYFYICDIDKNDSYKEIAIVPNVYTNDYYTSFFRYYDGKLHYIGGISYDTPDERTEDIETRYDANGLNITFGRPMIIDGSGYITASARADALNTWFGYTRYAYDPETGLIRRLANLEIYPYGYENRNSYSAVWKIIRKNWFHTDDPDYDPYDPVPDDSMLIRDITVYKEPSFDSESFVMKAQPAVATGVYNHADGRFVPEYDYSSYDWDEEQKKIWVYITAKDGTHGWFNLGDQERDWEKGNWYDPFNFVIAYD